MSLDYSLIEITDTEEVIPEKNIFTDCFLNRRYIDHNKWYKSKDLQKYYAKVAEVLYELFPLLEPAWDNYANDNILRMNVSDPNKFSMGAKVIDGTTSIITPSELNYIVGYDGRKNKTPYSELFFIDSTGFFYLDIIKTAGSDVKIIDFNDEKCKYVSYNLKAIIDNFLKFIR